MSPRPASGSGDRAAPAGEEPAAGEGETGGAAAREQASSAEGSSPLPRSAEPEGDDDSGERGVRRRGRWVEGSGRWRRVAPVVLLVGLGLALGLLRSEAPREQEITVRLEGPREGVTGVELQVLDGSGEAVSGARWSFAPGQAPGSVRGQARVKPGRWRVRVQVESGEPTHVERSVQLEGEPVSVVVRSGG